MDRVWGRWRGRPSLHRFTVSQKHECAMFDEQQHKFFQMLVSEPCPHTPGRHALLISADSSVESGGGLHSGKGVLAAALEEALIRH